MCTDFETEETNDLNGASAGILIHLKSVIRHTVNIFR